ncbi:MAG: OsmC family protein, partial [Flavobacteriales bacterium]
MTTSTPHYTLTYEGQLRTTVKHLQSSSEIITDAPVDNRGKGESFSPTDLVSSALASCVMTIMAIKAGDMGHETIDMEARVWKTMASNPRRIARIQVELDLHIPGVTDQQKLI